jgi:oligoribonuclease NrnB/cAMP/cGMP phosphodiesterase (DHH superfamily)
MAAFASANKPARLHQRITDILMTDISFSDAKTMKSFYDEFKDNFVWCDHHAPIIKASLTDGFSDAPGVRETDRSAILCVYKFLYDPFDEAYNEKKIPEILRILSAYDSWTFEKAGYDKDYASIVNKGVSLEFGHDFKSVCEYVGKLMSGEKGIPGVADFEAQGKIVDRSEKNKNSNLLDTVGDFTWTLDSGKRKACALFLQGGSSSMMFSGAADRVTNGIVFKRQPDTKWVISLYNTSDDDTFDCGLYMKNNYGGGGHKGAAGGTITEDKFIELLKKKTI